jgi:FkbM family methyltransferase
MNIKSIFRQFLENNGYLVFQKNYLPYLVSHCLDIKRLSGDPEGIQHIFDIGANIGELSLQYNKEFPWARIVAFEPVQKTFAKLQGAIRNNHQIFARNCALGRAAGRSEIFHGPIDSMHSMNADAFPGSTSEIIEVSTLDMEIKNGMPSPDFVKVDTEGFEMDVLEGSRGWLGSAGPKFLLLETTFRKPERTHPQLRHQTSFFRLYEFVGQFDFEFVGISNWGIER